MVEGFLPSHWTRKGIIHRVREVRRHAFIIHPRFECTTLFGRFILLGSTHNSPSFQPVAHSMRVARVQPGFQGPCFVPPPLYMRLVPNSSFFEQVHGGTMDLSTTPRSRPSRCEYLNAGAATAMCLTTESDPFFHSPWTTAFQGRRRTSSQSLLTIQPGMGDELSEQETARRRQTIKTGSVHDCYEVGESLGKGTFAVVREARHR